MIFWFWPPFLPKSCQKTGTFVFSAYGDLAASLIWIAAWELGKINYVSLLLKSKGGLLAASREMTHLGTCHSAWIPMGCTGDMSLLNYWIPLCEAAIIWGLLAWFLIGWHLWGLLKGPSCVSHLYAIFLDWTFCLLPSQVWASLSYETNSTCWETAAKRL